MLALFKQWLLYTSDNEYKQDDTYNAVHFSKPCCLVDLILKSEKKLTMRVHNLFQDRNQTLSFPARF